MDEEEQDRYHRHHRQGIQETNGLPRSPFEEKKDGDESKTDDRIHQLNSIEVVEETFLENAKTVR